VAEAAEILASRGVSVEVIDARWLNPFDEAAVLGSVQRTARIAVVHEANLTGGFGAEVVARVVAAGFDYLDAPPVRIGLPDTRVPAAPHLQRELIPSVDRIAAEVQRLVEA
jgi:pyruvate/2-oxoglutarate/acetoin dehydrogenase E1 component